MKYDAFISYKHHLSTDFAREFELHLKRYGRSPLAQPAVIFRDEQHLKVGEDITEAIRIALAASDYFILLASPEAADSIWVLEELQIWCEELKRADQLIVVLTSGSIGVTPEGKTIDWDKTDALPETLKNFLPELPLFVDLSWAVTSTQRNLDEPRYKVAVNAVASRLLNLDPNILLGQEWKIRRRNLILAWGTAGVLLALFLIVGVGAIILNDRNTELDRALNVALSRQWAAQAPLESAPDALLTAAKAAEYSQNNESTRSLLDTLGRYHRLRKHVAKLSGESSKIAFDHKTSQFILPSQDGTILRWSLSGTPLTPMDFSLPGRIDRVAVLGSGEIIASRGMTLWNATLEQKITKLHDMITAISCGPLEHEVVAALANGEIVLIDKKDSSFRTLYSHRGVPSQIVATPSWIISVALSESVPVMIYSVTKDQALPLPKAPFSANGVAISPIENQFSIAFEDGSIGAWRLPDLSNIWMDRLPYSASATGFHINGKQMAFGSSAGVIYIRDENGDDLDRWEALSGGVWSVNWSEDNLFSCDSDGWVRLWTPSDPGPVGKTLPKADYLMWKGNELIGFNSLGIWQYSHDGNLSETKRSFGKIVAATGTIAVSKETDYVVKVHRLDHPKKFLSFKDLPAKHSIKEIELSASGRYLAISWWPEDSDSGRLCIWNVAENKVTWLQQTPGYISALAFFKDEFLAASGRGGSITVWRVDDGKLMSQLKDDNGIPIEALAFADRENLLVGYLRGVIELHRVGNLGVSISRTEIPAGAIRDIATTINGDIIATDVAGANWFDASLTYKGKLLNTEGSLDKAWNISVSPKGKAVAFKLQSGKTVLVPLAIEEWVTAARARAIVGTGSM